MFDRIRVAWPRHGLWGHPDFMRLWSAQAISAWGSRISRTALPIIAIVTVDATPAQVGMLSALSVAPQVAVGLLMGGRVDRSSKRRLLIGADLARAGILLTVPMAAWWGLLSMPQLYAVAALMGAATALFQLTDNAYLPVLVGKRNLVEGNSKLESTDAVAEVGGPSAAGILIELITAPMAMVIDAASYLVSALLLLRIRAAERLPESVEAHPNLRSDIATGFRVALGDPLVRPLMLAEANLAIFSGFLFTLYMIFALETLSLSASVIGVLIGVGGVGAFFGAFIAQRIPRGVGIGPAMIVFLALGQGAALCIPLAQGPTWLVVGLLFLHQFFGDALMVAYLIHATSLRQTVLPLHSLGRANAASQVLTGLLLPGGALLAGVLATWVGVRTGVWIGVLGGLFTPLLLIFSPLRRLQSMPDSPDWEHPDTGEA